LTYTPLWVFYRDDEILDDLSQLKGKRIVIGPEGSGIRKFALTLLKAADVAGPPTELYDFTYPIARQAMIEGRADVVMLLGSAENHRFVVELLSTKDIRLMNFSQAEAYSRLFPDLSHIILPRGVISPAKRSPPSDVHLLSPTTNLIVRKDVHPALVYLLLKASVEIHGSAGWFNKAGEFPNLNKQDDPICDQARRFYRSGGSPLYAYLPFWAATFIDRMILVLIPLGMIIIPLIGILPWVYTWKNRSKYYRWYRELMKIERELTTPMKPDVISEFQAKLDQMEKAIGKIRLSVAFYDEVFILKEHIQLVRQKLVPEKNGPDAK
ncbi:MAG: TAXI family TRAP transporter solute-binding subunit, partial [Syntrophales bacterium]|nr:TAXI family TRAP transporter solute-binding subunit [Syntrophales bacterium]